MRNIISILALSVGLVACNAQSTGEAGADAAFQDINVEKAQQMIQEEDPLIIDVRTPDEFASGHIEGAQLLDFYSGDFEEGLEKLPKDDTILVYCHSGNRSGKTMARMKELGFEKVYNLEGGMSSWKRTGKPVEK